MMQRKFLTLAILIGTDLLALLASLSIGLLVRRTILPHISGLFFTTAVWRQEYLWLLIITIGVLAYEGLYSHRRSGWEELRHLLRGLSIAMIVFLAATTIFKVGQEISRPTLFITWAIAPWLICSLRLLVKRVLLRRCRFWLRRVLLLGGGQEAVELASRMSAVPELGYQLVGYLSDDGLPKDAGALNYLGSLANLEAVMRGSSIDEVVIALPGASRLQQFSLLKRAESLAPRVFVLPQLFDADKLNVEIERIERYFLLAFPNNLVKKSNRLLKNATEILLVLGFLPVWGCLLFFLSLAVKLTSPGEIFFRQRRIGSGGKPFFCLKFRTMVDNAEQILAKYLEDNPAARTEWEMERKLKFDPRVTRFGFWLRKTSLDELPQLFNIVMGEMSLVGPRPIVADEISKYGENIQYYYAVSPGLTGLWQVSGRNDVDYHQRVMLDTFYVRNWSLWLDFMILLRTIPAVLKKDGAY